VYGNESNDDNTADTKPGALLVRTNKRTIELRARERENIEIIILVV
jgi:hypothetical protein